MLTGAQIEQYRHDGYLFPFPALSGDELAQCNEGMARYESWLGTPVNKGDFRWRSASYVILPWVDALVLVAAIVVFIGCAKVIQKRNLVKGI